METIVVKVHHSGRYNDNCFELRQLMLVYRHQTHCTKHEWYNERAVRERASSNNIFVVISNVYREMGLWRWWKPLNSAFVVEPKKFSMRSKLIVDKVDISRGL